MASFFIVKEQITPLKPTEKFFKSILLGVDNEAILANVSLFFTKISDSSQFIALTLSRPFKSEAILIFNLPPITEFVTFRS